MKNQRGLSLIEVMVAVFVLATGLLGLGALQARSLVYSQSAYYRSVAADLAADLADRIRANRSPIIQAGALPPDFSTCTQSGGTVTGCPTDYRVASDMSEWNTNLRAVLSNGRFTLTSAADSTNTNYRYTLTITWFDDRSCKSGDSSCTSDASYVTVIE